MLDHNIRDEFRRLASVELDPRALSPDISNTRNIGYLLKAADIADEIFWQQISPYIDRSSLLERAGDDDELKEILLFNYGPYDRLRSNAPLLPGESKYVGAGFYPRGLTREDFAGYLETFPECRSSFESPYTIVRRRSSRLVAIPYHEAYQAQVRYLNQVLTSASEIEHDPHFSRYLFQRGQDVLTDDYSRSDRLWVGLENNPIDLIVGPYEVYDDQLMGLKAAYEAFVFSREFEATSKIKQLSHEIPLLARSSKVELGGDVEIEISRIKLSIGNLIYAGGEARAAIPAIASTLPNDEQVIEEVGARQIIFKNVLESKFHFVGWPILLNSLQEPAGDEGASFEQFFEHTILHEISHSIGPHRIIRNGESTTVNRCLKQYHSAIEEAKADTLAACLLLEKYGDAGSHTFLETYVSGLVRAIRLGLTSAHCSARAIQLNFLFRENAVSIDAGTGRIVIDHSRFRQAIFKLATEIKGIQQHGNFAAAEHLVATHRTKNAHMESLIDKLSFIPLEIRIHYTTRS
jgi:hypothetical protein